MKYRWLVVLACVLVTACSSPAKEEADKVADSKAAETKSAETKTVETKTAETKTVETKSEETESAETKSAETETVEAKKEPVTAAGLVAEYDAALEQWMGKMRSAKPAERAAVMQSNPTADFAEKFRSLVSENANSEMVATALGWLASNSDKAEEKISSLATLLESHFDSPAIKDAATAIASGKPSKSAEDNLRRIMKDSPHAEARGVAAYQLVSFLDRNKSYTDRIDELAENPGAVKFFGEDGLDYLRNLKVDDAEIEKLYESIVKDYSDVVFSRMGRKTNIGEVAKNALFEIRNLSMGCVAPNIEGSDLDGKEFSLADYRGKVVMLDFWGDW